MLIEFDFFLWSIVTPFTFLAPSAFPNEAFHNLSTLCHFTQQELTGTSVYYSVRNNKEYKLSPDPANT